MIWENQTNWLQMVLCLAVALVLSTVIGFERELKNKAAGMRTHTVVGLGAALFMIVSKYGFTDILSDHVMLDPSRVAAQIVSGIGFIGAGLVFVRRNKVRGLTTAASIWLTAAVGTAAGAGLLIPAVFVTAAYFLIVYLYPWIARNTSLRSLRVHALKVWYADGTGALREILLACTERGFQIQGFNTHRDNASGGVISRLLDGGDVDEIRGQQIQVELEIEGTDSLAGLIRDLSALENVTGVEVDDPD